MLLPDAIAGNLKYDLIIPLASVGERLGEGKFSVSCVEKCRLDITRRMIAAGSTRKLVALKELIEVKIVTRTNLCAEERSNPISSDVSHN